MSDEADPPRKHYGFKEASFERLNPPRPEAPPANSASPGETVSPPTDPNDVFTILQKNRTVEQQAGRDKVEPRNMKSRRARDYWLILLPCEAALGAVAWFGGGNTMVWVCAISGMVLLGVGLTWAMWQVMNKY